MTGQNRLLLLIIALAYEFWLLFDEYAQHRVITGIRCGPNFNSTRFSFTKKDIVSHLLYVSVVLLQSCAWVCAAILGWESRCV